MILAIVVLLALFLSLQTRRVGATERTFEYTTLGCRYQIYTEVPDTWHFGTSLEVKVRITLMQKSVGNKTIEYITSYPQMAHWSRHLLGIRVSGPSGRWGEIEYEESVNFTQNGDYWEKQFSLEMDTWTASKLKRDGTEEATFKVGFNLIEYDTWGRDFVEPWAPGVHSSLEESIKVTVFRPFLSTVETIGISISGVSAVAGLFVFSQYKLKRISFCRWNYHDWRLYGDRVFVRWNERRIEESFHTPRLVGRQRQDVVHSRRQCLRCGLRQKRKLTQNEDDAWEVYGWEDIGYTSPYPPNC